MEIPVHEGCKHKKQFGPIPPTRSVIFLANTAGGLLAKRFQETELEAGNVTGYRIRITESAVTSLSMLLPSTNLWGPQYCTRQDCNLYDKKRIDCRKMNILYESE